MVFEPSPLDLGCIPLTSAKLEGKRPLLSTLI